MGNTFTQIYIHLVFAVKGRQNLISTAHQEELHKYVTGIVHGKGQKMLAVFCMPDHSHVLVGIKPSIAVSDLVRDIKANSSGFINDQKWVLGKFSWQDGFGAFSHSRGELDKVVKYTLNQEEHHEKRSFKDEYLAFLKKFEVEYDEQYLFEWYD